jgi:hypothetical protein
MVSPPALNRRSHDRGRRAPTAASSDNVVPYDYGATFAITGSAGAVREDVINISPDGIFVAVAIGYGFAEERGRNLALTLGPPPPTELAPGNVTLGQIPPAALIEGVRVNPRFASLVFAQESSAGGNSNQQTRERELLGHPVPASFLTSGDARSGTVFERMRAPAQISFLFSLVDSATGRELQDEPTHNLASLGKSNGERPFRWLAQPVTFMPRSTVRLQVIERSQDVRGTLFIVLYGYKVLGSMSCAEPIARRIAAQVARHGDATRQPTERIIPFDYVTTFALTGRPGNLVEAEATVNAEGGFAATSIGYGLLVEEQDVKIDLIEAAVALNPAAPPPPPPPPTVDLAALPLRALPAGALADGFRIRPELLRVAFQDNGVLSSQLPVSWLDQLFERLNRIEDVSFLYTIYDGGRGRDLQNEPLHNIAGLGIANGDRPFKKFARPLVFMPRSTIRLRVEERFGRGTLFIVFQGYKVLTAPGGAR